jgi:hypothetical protein
MKDSGYIERKIDRLADAYYENEKPDPRVHAQIEALEWVIGQHDSVIDDMEISGRPLTEDEIKQAIVMHCKSKTKLPEYSVFGDNNWRNIDAQIDILNWVLETK